MIVDCSCRSHNGFLLKAKGLGETAQRDLEMYGNPEVHLSVGTSKGKPERSETRRDQLDYFDEGLIDEQYRRFLDDVPGGF